MKHSTMRHSDTLPNAPRRVSGLCVTLLVIGASFVSLGGCGDLERCVPGANGCIADHNDVTPCEPGTRETPDEFCSDEVFYDACIYRGDHICDDGSTGSEDALCQYGADFTDCGFRPNPCAGDFANPVYCPQTPNRCWPTTVDCNTVRYCVAGSEPSARACSKGEMVDCSALPANTCKPTQCPDPAKPVQCMGSTGCFAPMIDCNTVTTCGSLLVACFTGESVSCGTGGADPSCVPN